MGGDHAKMVAMMELYIKYSLHVGGTTELVWRSQEMLYRKDGTWVEIGRNRILPDEPVWWTENISKEIEGRSLGREAERVWMYSYTPWWLSGTGAWSGRMMLGWMRLCGGGKMNPILEAPLHIVESSFLSHVYILQLQGSQSAQLVCCKHPDCVQGCLFSA